MKYGYLNPSYFHAFSDQFVAAAGIYFVRTDHFLTAYHGALVYRPTPPHSFRLDYSTGRTLEDAGLESNFDSINLEYGYRFKRYTIFGSYGDYHSGYRKEQSYGVRLEIR